MRGGYINKYDSFFSIDKKSFVKLEQYADNFKKIEEVKTDLVYNYPNAIVSPLFSIIIPTCNRTELFFRALNSVLKQDIGRTEWEIIVVDNSRMVDGTTFAYDLIKEIDNERISYIHNDVDIGPGYNWNRGVILSKGKWAIFLHDDDELDIDALKKIEQILKSNRKYTKNMVYLTNNYRSCDSSKNNDYCIKLTQIGTLIHGHTRTGKPSCGTCILREAYVETGGVNYDFGPTADAILGYLMMKKYGVYCYMGKLGKHNDDDSSTNDCHVLEQLINTDELFAKYRYNKTIIGKIWGFLFSRVITKKNLSEKEKINIDLDNKANFNQCVYYCYGVRVNIITSNLYKVTVLLYDLINTVNGKLTKKAN